MNTNFGIEKSDLKNISFQLNRLLVDEFNLFTRTRNCHWNIEGSNFMELRRFFHNQVEQLDHVIDEVAKRTRTLGHYVETRMKDYNKLSRINEPEYTSRQNEQLKNLLSDHESIIENLRSLVIDVKRKHNDFGTADFITGLLKQHEKMTWIIRSYIN